jgi:hypothetical protein
MQTPDFWSIPFAGGAATHRPAPPALAEVLGEAVPHPDRLPRPLRYDDDLAEALTNDLGRRWLTVPEQLRATVTLGMLTVDDVARAASVTADDAVRAYGLAAAGACWAR